MAQEQNGFNRRSSSTARTFPGTATRVPTTATPLVDGFHPQRGRVSTESTPTVFVRPISRTRLPPSTTTTSPSSTTTLGSSLSPSSSLSRGGGGGVSVGGSSGGLIIPPPVAARPISLETPRPDSERHKNLYLGAPIPLNNSSGGGGGGHQSSVSSLTSPSSAHHKGYFDSSVTAAEQVRLPTSSKLSKSKSHSDRNNSDKCVVTLQPSKINLLDSRGGEDGEKTKLPESSIICPYCRKCRCEACSTPRSLPSRWICSDSIHCGPEPLIDYVTCLCCVKALFYHCGKDHEPDGGVTCADKPCSCAPHRKFWRWGCLAAMSFVFPCLCLYWPCKGCVRVAEKAYQKYHNNGCTCNRSTSTTDSKSTRGDLQVETSSEDEGHHHHHLHTSTFSHIRSSSGGPPTPASSTFLPSRRK